jgi:hypothetical protein
MAGMQTALRESWEECRIVLLCQMGSPTTPVYLLAYLI